LNLSPEDVANRAENERKMLADLAAMMHRKSAG